MAVKEKVKEKRKVTAFAPAPAHTPVRVDISGLFDKLFKGMSEREARTLEMRFGLRKYEKHTLEAIGQAFGITRERVRQIENAAISKLAEIGIVDLSGILSTAEKMLSLHGGVLIKNHLLRELRIAIDSDSEADMNYLALALMTSPVIITVHNTIKFHPYYCLSDVGTRTVLNTAGIVANKLKRRKEAMTTAEIQKITSAEMDYTPSEQTIVNICRISKELKVTENGRVGLFKWSHINPRNIHDKIVFVMKKRKRPLHFSALTQAIVNLAFDDKTINVQAVHNELIRDDSFVLIGRGIYALKEWGYKPGTVKDVIVDILKEHGPLDKETIIDKVFAVRQVKKITILLNLKKKELFERVGRNRYGLR